MAESVPDDPDRSIWCKGRTHAFDRVLLGMVTDDVEVMHDIWSVQSCGTLACRKQDMAAVGIGLQILATDRILGEVAAVVCLRWRAEVGAGVTCGW